MGTPTFKLAGLSKSKTGVHKEGKMSQYEVYRGVSDFLRPRDPFFILLKSVSRRREKKERLRRDAAPGNAKLQFGMCSMYSPYPLCSRYEAFFQDMPT